MEDGNDSMHACGYIVEREFDREDEMRRSASTSDLVPIVGTTRELRHKNGNQMKRKWRSYSRHGRGGLRCLRRQLGTSPQKCLRLHTPGLRQ
jgi:hypothetical protein